MQIEINDKAERKIREEKEKQEEENDEGEQHVKKTYTRKEKGKVSLLMSDKTKWEGDDDW